MCVYHYEDSRRADCWIKILLLGCLGFSAAVSIPMFILTYPGDECLLFVSVRGEALIYGNPAGCNFIAYGHGIIGLIGKRDNLHFNLVFLLVILWKVITENKIRFQKEQVVCSSVD